LVGRDRSIARTKIYATGGMLLSGDDLTKINAEKLAMLRKLQPPTGVAARFSDESLRVGTIKFPGSRAVCLFNWDDAPQTISFRLSRSSSIADFWSGENLGRHEGDFTVKELPPHSAKLLVAS
jgi:alpha-galactosidase